MTFLRNLLAALSLAAFGIYVLRHYPGTAGLVVGGLSVGGALSIAFPTQMHDGASSLKSTLVLLLPTVFDALKGGSRRTDPPPDPPKKDGTP